MVGCRVREVLFLFLFHGIYPITCMDGIVMFFFYPLEGSSENVQSNEAVLLKGTFLYILTDMSETGGYIINLIILLRKWFIVD